jgi:hypothetical protein
MRVDVREPLGEPYRVDLAAYHTMVRLLAGVLDTRYVNQVNLARQAHEPI